MLTKIDFESHEIGASRPSIRSKMPAPPVIIGDKIWHLTPTIPITRHLRATWSYFESFLLIFIRVFDITLIKWRQYNEIGKPRGIAALWQVKYNAVTAGDYSSRHNAWDAIDVLQLIFNTLRNHVTKIYSTPSFTLEIHLLSKMGKQKAMIGSKPSPARPVTVSLAHSTRRLFIANKLPRPRFRRWTLVSSRRRLHAKPERITGDD